MRRRIVRGEFSPSRKLNPVNCGAETLESRVLFAASPSPLRLRVSDALANLYDTSVAGQDVGKFASDNSLQLDDQGRVSVTLRATNLDSMSTALGSLGFVKTASFPDLHFVEGLLPIRSVKAAEAISGRGRYGIEVNYAPIVHAGSVADQADFVLEADRERATTPGAFDGTGQRVGVLSNSYNHLGGAAAGIASGDLPAAGVTVIADSNSSSDTDEGRAMLELIHDVAPGAGLAFATANGGEGTFANNITALANPAQGNCNDITDDVSYFAEPMFLDGVISQAIDTAVTTRGVNYFTSAGNSANRSYESTSFSTVADTVGGTSGNFYDFDPGAGVDTRQQITVPNGVRVVITLQWDDPFYTVSGVDTDLDIFIVDNSNVVKAQASVANISTQAPTETVQYTNNSGATQTLNVAIQKFSGPNPGRIKYVSYGSTSTTIDQFATNSSAIDQHAAAANGQGVGAAAYFQQDVPEGFTSKGGSTILFNKTGTPIAPQTRNTPQITAPDGSNTTFFGSDFEGDGRPNFFGTSAAAPHAAAVAALVRQANPGFTPAQVYSRMQTTADDITVSGAGFDTLTGFGMINAFDAVYPTVATASLNFSDGFESGVLPSYYETRSTNSGHIQITSANGPFAGTMHVTMDTSVAFSVGGVNQLGLNELTLHVNASGAGTKTLTFRQREFTDEDQAMPATFTNSTNADGVALSVDGVNWFRIVSLTGAASTSTYTLNTFNLTTIAAAAGITLGADTRIRFQQIDDFPIAGGDGMAFDEIAVTSSGGGVSATPGTPDLVAATDTGTSSTDNVTNRDNSSAAKNLQFSVSGTVAGATVSIYSSGTLIGTAVAAGTTTTVTTNGTVDLADGGRSITARQTESGKSESADSSALSVTIDTVAPTADVVDVAPDPRVVGVSSVGVNFSEAVAGFDLTDLSLTRDAGSNLLTATNAPTGGSTNFTVPNLLAPTSVSGSYVLTVTASGSGITDTAGNAFASNASDTWVHSLPAWLSASGTAASWNSQTKALTITGTATIIADPAADTPAVSVTGASAALTVNPTSDSVINLATLSVASGGVTTVSNHGANPVRALVLNTNPTIAAATKLDLTNNVLVVRNGTASGIQAQIAATYAAGAWTGTGGIASSAAATDPTDSTALGFASNASLNKTSFAGVTGLTNTAVIVKFTYSGDANLDGQVDIGDLGLLAGSWQQSGKSWFDGDFSYDGAVNIGDLGLLAGNWQKGVGNPL
jgi:hypothetical protein